MHNKYKGRNKVSENKGITLIALIVTIIVLLILAGVTLNMILDENGLINKAQSAVKTQNVAAIKEALVLEKTELYLAKGSLNIDDFIDQITTGNKSFTVDSIDKISDTELEIVINGDNKFIIKDNGNGDLDIEYKGVAQVGDLRLSATSGTFTYPTSGTFTVTNNSTGGALSVSSSMPNIATASISGNTVTVTPGTTAGKAKIVVKSAAVGEYAENRAIYMATVENGTISVSATPYTGTYDGAEHDALTNVKTTPTGTTITYSLNGGTYSSTMPKVQGGGTFTVSVSASKAGYKTQVETYTVTVNKADGDLTLSATSGTVVLGTPGSFTVTGNTSGGAISATSDNTSVADVSVSGNTITVTPKSEGTATITVKSAATSNYNEKTATYTVNVEYGVTVTPAQIAADPTTYYGAKVTNYTAGGATWRIFYVDTDDGPDGNGKYGDGKNTVYLIAEYDDNRQQALGTYLNSTYTANEYDTTKTKIKLMNPIWAKKRGSSESSWNPNEKAAAYLCDTSKWETYYDSTKAKYAIGSPSLEMYADSYNKTHNSNSLVYTYNTTTGTASSNSGNGYFVGANGTYSNNGWYTNDNIINTSQNGIYMVSGKYFWLASPSALNAGLVSRVSGGNASVGDNYLYRTVGVRPLVSLKSDFQIKIEV